MDKEIKEILEFLKEPFGKEKTHKAIDKKDTQKLLIYITNLQQENERLKEWKEDLLKENIELENIRKKAIEYIKNNMQYDDNIDDNWVMTNDLLNILQNGSENDEC